MKLIQPKAEYLPQEPGIKGIYKTIELAGRTCYRSEDKITESSAKPFVDRMIASKHLSMLEHGTVYLSADTLKENINYSIFTESPYAVTVYSHNIENTTTNLRAIIELFPNTWHGFLNTYICEPTEFHEKRYTFRLITDRGVSHELVRHRVFSFAQESTRYCNYSRGKFGKELTFIIPSWATHLREGGFDDTLAQDAFWHDVNGGEVMRVDDKEMCLMGVLNKAESCYMDSLERGLTPQQARQMLPNAIKTEICMTGLASDWRHFFDLRYYGETGKPHPDIQQLAALIKVEAEKTGIWEDIMSKPSKFE